METNIIDKMSIEGALASICTPELIAEIKLNESGISKGWVFDARSMLESLRGITAKTISFDQAEEIKRVNINVPYSEKDEAKKHGARWDAINKTWYVIGDTTPFAQWMPKKIETYNKLNQAKKKAPIKTELITLEQYLKSRHTKVKVLTHAEAKILGIPYPLIKGWAIKYGNKAINQLTLEKLNTAKANKKKYKKYRKK